jgi:hypothetical protein
VDSGEEMRQTLSAMHGLEFLVRFGSGFSHESMKPNPFLLAETPP